MKNTFKEKFQNTYYYLNNNNKKIQVNKIYIKLYSNTRIRCELLN